MVRGPNWIGDHIMAEGFYRGLRKLYAGHHISLVSRVAAPELGFVAWDEYTPLGKGPLESEPRNFDLAITLVASVSAAVHLWRSGAKVRIGYAESVASLFLTDSLQWPGRIAGKHKRELYGDLLCWLGGHPETASAELEPAVPQKRVIIAPGASIGLREWPYFPELMGELNACFPDWEIVVVGSADQAHWSSRFRRLGFKLDDKIGKTSLGELTSLLGKGGIVICNDSGVAHLAALCGNPVLVLFGPGDPRYVSPGGQHVSIIRNPDLSCSPCESARCRAPFGYQRCLRSISVEAVMEKFSQVAIGSTLPRNRANLSVP